MTRALVGGVLAFLVMVLLRSSLAFIGWWQTSRCCEVGLMTATIWCLPTVMFHAVPVGLAFAVAVGIKQPGDTSASAKAPLFWRLSVIVVIGLVLGVTIGWWWAPGCNHRGKLALLHALPPMNSPTYTPNPDFELPPGPFALGFSELSAEIAARREHQTSTWDPAREYRIAYHYLLSVPLWSPALGLFSLGIAAWTLSTHMGIRLAATAGLSFGCQSMLNWGFRAARLDIIPPWLAMWAGPAVVCVAGAGLFVAKQYYEDAQPTAEAAATTSGLR